MQTIRPPSWPQLKIEEDYTLDEYGTQAAPDTVQIQPGIPIAPYSMMPLQQLVRSTFKLVTIPYGGGPSTNTQFGDTQFVDLFISRWPVPRTKREYAYGPAARLPDTNVGTFSNSLMAEAKERGWTVISMKKEWNRLFNFQKYGCQAGGARNQLCERTRNRWNFWKSSD
jgi:hypothetical protein